MNQQMEYHEFISGKSLRAEPSGFEPARSMYPSAIMPHQSASVTWACRRGRALLAHDTGLGKTLSQLTWGDQVQRYTDGFVLILTPLAVALQTEREAAKFGLNARFADSDAAITGPGIWISNYEKLHHFDTSIFSGVVLDESSILKAMDGRMRAQITDAFSDTPYRLSCTATPAPNDYMELGTQAEFLGIMSQVEMLAMFFIHDGADTSKWRLKNHGKTRFWEWLSTWAMFLQSPADLGFDASGYDLPPVEYHSYEIETSPSGSLFAEPAQSLQERNKARRDTIDARCHKAAEIVNALDEPAVIWCHLNAESELLAQIITGAVEIKGADDPQHKANSMLAFADGTIKALVTKPKIAGFGMNWQSSRHCVFVGLSDSWESYYQAIRRQWRFGQTRNVHCHIISADIEGAVVENIRRKDLQHAELTSAMMAHMADFLRAEVLGATTEKTDYLPDQSLQIPEWIAPA